MTKTNSHRRFARILPRFVTRSSYKHDPLLISSLLQFNFRAPLLLEFPGEDIHGPTSALHQFAGENTTRITT